MKILLVILGAAAATLGLYASGFVTAMAYLSAEPTPVWKPNRDEGGLWTLEPVAVTAGDQDFERLPARGVAGGALVASAAAADGPDGKAALDEDPVEAPVDGAATASIAGDADLVPDDETEPRRARAPAMSAAHVQWCLDRYRSYRIEDDSYTPYGGGSRACVSPYVAGSAGISPGGQAYAQADDPLADARADVPLQRRTYLTPGHIQSCFDRYRSYRPSDNSYQPYGGGPRRQCR